jgi:hypothetical protein
MSLLLNDRVALATDRTGVNTPETMFPDSGPIDTRFFRKSTAHEPGSGVNFRVARHSRLARSLLTMGTDSSRNAAAE